MIRRTIKKFGRPTVATLAYLTGYCHLAEVLGAGQGARIISYHGIDDNPANPYAVSTNDLALEMRFLAENFSLFSVDQLAILIRNRDADSAESGRGYLR